MELASAALALFSRTSILSRSSLRRLGTMAHSLSASRMHLAAIASAAAASFSLAVAAAEVAAAQRRSARPRATGTAAPFMHHSRHSRHRDSYVMIHAFIYAFIHSFIQLLVSQKNDSGSID